MITSADEFKYLRESEDAAEYTRAAQESAPLAVWMEVIRRFPELREWVALNKTVPDEVLEVLAQDPELRVRAFVATKRKLSEKLQLVLAQDPDESVRQRLAWNARATEATLRVLAEDASALVAEHARLRQTERAVD